LIEPIVGSDSLNPAGLIDVPDESLVLDSLFVVVVGGGSQQEAGKIKVFYSELKHNQFFTNDTRVR